MQWRCRAWESSSATAAVLVTSRSCGAPRAAAAATRRRCAGDDDDAQLSLSLSPPSSSRRLWRSWVFAGAGVRLPSPTTGLSSSASCAPRPAIMPGQRRGACCLLLLELHAEGRVTRIKRHASLLCSSVCFLERHGTGLSAQEAQLEARERVHRRCSGDGRHEQGQRFKQTQQRRRDEAQAGGKRAEEAEAQEEGECLKACSSSVGSVRNCLQSPVG